MTHGELAYLTLTIAGTLLFAVTLAWVSHRERVGNSGGARKQASPGRSMEQFAASKN